MIEVLVIIAFLVVFLSMYHQIDNPEVPYTKLNEEEEKEEKEEGHDLIIPPIYDFIAKHKQSYLKSDKWNTLRKAVLKRDNYTCKQCGISQVPLEVHHVTYARFGNEWTEDLESVCRDCHQAIHNHYGYNYRTKFNLLKGKPNEQKWY